MLDVVPAGLLGVRDRALLLLGFDGGFRRSELVAALTSLMSSGANIVLTEGWSGVWTLDAITGRVVEPFHILA